MKILFKNLLSSFDNSTDGFSGRKLTALWFSMLAAYLGIKHTTPGNLIEVLMILAAVILLCLGLVTFQQIIDFKNGKRNEKTEQGPNN